MFEKILIANRGEIAVRILSTCKRLGIGTVAVYSEPDSRSLHRQMADEAVFLGPAPARESYLAQEKIVDAALASGCKAIHPGYGFLAENARFAELTHQAGLVFIGPPDAVIARLGDKLESKKMAAAAALPVIPGPLRSIASIDEAHRVIGEIGFPVLIKPVMGGGGKGMRIVTRSEEIEPAFTASRSEAQKAFGDDRILIESLLAKPRHVEIQILADHHGNVVHLGERECSVQRRHQKIIEESPSTALNDALRERMGTLACALARHTGYANAGTVEFVLDEHGNFHFLEVNTRLQVEHPVTEVLTSLDLVELQIRIAARERLPFRQDEVKFKGWAIEVRVCAEDPNRGFLPATGMVTRYWPPHGRRIRVDSGVDAGSVISAHYDSMMAKVIARGEDREQARKTLIDALNGYHLEGVATNIDFANAVLNHPAFAAGELSTGFIENHFEDGTSRLAPPIRDLHHMAIAATLIYHNREKLLRESLRPMAAHVGGTPESRPWHDYWVKTGGDTFEMRLKPDELSVRLWTVWVNGAEYRVITPRFEFYRRRLKLEISGQQCRFILQYRGNFTGIAYNGIVRILEIYSPLEWKLTPYVPVPAEKAPQNALPSPMPGMILDVRVEPGTRVYKGQELVVIESMKMESGVASPCDAVIEKVMVKPGQAVDAGDILFTYKP